MEKHSVWFKKGMRDAIPIGLGYFAVSFTFGMMAQTAGIPIFWATLISLTNVTSAGQFAALPIIAAQGSVAELALTQLVINLRYSLMSFSLSQKIEPKTGVPLRMAVSYGITDEIFGIASSHPGPVTPPYMFGIISVSAAGWTLGTLLGAVCGDILPGVIVSSLGILVYGMFIAIIVPPVRKSRPVLAAVLLSAASSIVISYFFKSVSAGFAIIISAASSAALTAAAAPLPDGEGEERA